MNTQSKLQKYPCLQEECFGCANCTGICHALIEFLVVPDAVIKSGQVRND